MLRLPQDVSPGDVLGVPPRDRYADDVGVREQRYEAARGAGHPSRALACWGLVSAGPAALPWARRQLHSGEQDRICDAAGVLAHVGVPPELLPRLRRLGRELDDGEAKDAVLALVPVADEARPEPHGLLLGGRLDAFTESIWFVEAPLDDVVSATEAWSEEMDLGRTGRACDGPLDSLLALLEPWAVPSWTWLWVETDSAWTALFSQGSDVYDSTVLSRRLGRRALATNHSPAVARGGRVVRHGNTCLRYRDPAQSCGAGLHDDTRVLQATQQSRWEWHAYGPTQSFEEPQRYEARVIRRRFDLAALNEYCARLGIRRDDPAFYGPRGHLCTADLSRRRGTARTASAQEWLADHSFEAALRP